MLIKITRGFAEPSCGRWTLNALPLPQASQMGFPCWDRKIYRPGWTKCGAIPQDKSERKTPFGRANDAVQLALHPQDVDADSLDLSAVSEFRVTDKGGVEVKLLDRVKALEALCGLLDCAGDANLLYQALENAAGQLEGGCGCN